MASRLTQRLQTTPMLIAEIDGLTICEPLQFLRVATEGDASESANRLAGVDDFPVHEDAL